MRFCVVLHEILVEMSSPIGKRLWMRNPAFLDFGSKQWAEAVPPQSDRFAADFYAAFVK